MTKEPEDFWAGYDACLAEVRRDRIASEKVTCLKGDMPPETRANIALNTLKDAVSTLEMVADAVTASRGDLEALDELDTRISLLRMKLGMSRGLIHLTSSMGKAP